MRSLSGSSDWGTVVCPNCHAMLQKGRQSLLPRKSSISHGTLQRSRLALIWVMPIVALSGYKIAYCWMEVFDGIGPCSRSRHPLKQKRVGAGAAVAVAVYAGSAALGALLVPNAQRADCPGPNSRELAVRAGQRLPRPGLLNKVRLTV